MGRVTVDQEVMGLAHYLSKQAKLSDVICATTLPKFHIIFSGIVPPNPAELLGNRLFKDMIRVVRDVYDYVIVDTPPLGPVSYTHLDVYKRQHHDVYRFFRYRGPCL